MTITATELKMNLHKYLMLSQSEDVYVTTNGRLVTKLSNPFNENLKELEKFYGAAPGNITLEDALKKKVDEL